MILEAEVKEDYAENDYASLKRSFSIQQYLYSIKIKRKITSIRIVKYQ